MGKTGMRLAVGLGLLVAVVASFAFGMLTASSAKTAAPKAPALAAPAKITSKPATAHTAQHASSVSAQAAGAAAVTACYGCAPPILSILHDPCLGALEQISGANFDPSEAVVLQIGTQTVGTATTNSAGSFVVDIATAGLALGAHTVVATDTTGLTASIVIHVLSCASSSGSGGGGLAMTGSDVEAALLAAVGLLILGGSVQLFASRRARATAHDGSHDSI
jgi:hypothetical protein